MHYFLKICIFLSFWTFFHPVFSDRGPEKEETFFLRPRYRDRVEEEKNPSKTFLKTASEDPQSFFNSLKPSSGSDLEKVVVKAKTLENSQIAEFYERISPAQFIGISWANASLLSLIANLTADRCNDSASHRVSSCLWENENELWGEFLFDSLNQHRMDQLQGFKASSNGILMGYDRNLSEVLPNFKVGINAGYAHTHLDWLDSFGNSRVHSTFLGVYAGYCRYGFSFDSSLIGFWQNYHNNRTIDLIEIKETAKSRYNGNSIVFHLGGQYSFFLQQELDLNTFGSIDLLYTSQNSFTESDANTLNLNVKTHGESFLRSELGLSVSRSICCLWGTLVPKINVSWLSLLPLSGNRITSNLKESSEFTVGTSKQCVNQVATEIQLILWMDNDLSFGGTYKGIFGSEISEQVARGTVFWKF